MEQAEKLCNFVFIFDSAEKVVNGRFVDPEKCTGTSEPFEEWWSQGSRASVASLKRDCCHPDVPSDCQLKRTTQKSRQRDPTSFELIARCLRPSTKAGLL